MNHEENVDDPIAFFSALGGMHDARMTSLVFDVTTRSLAISVDDLNSNFLGLPEYSGKRGAVISLFGLSSLDADFNWVAGDWSIYDFEISRAGERYRLDLRMAPGGLLKCEFESASATPVDDEN